MFEVGVWSGFENLEFLNVFLDSFNPKLNNHYYTCKLHFVQIQSNILYWGVPIPSTTQRQPATDDNSNNNDNSNTNSNHEFVNVSNNNNNNNNNGNN